MFARLFVCLAAVLCMIATAAYAQPSISPATPVTFREGETLTILGDGFGSKGTGQRIRPLLWDDFEAGTNGDAIPTDSNPAQTDSWTYASGSIRYSTRNNLPGSLMCSEHDMSGNGVDPTARHANLYFATDKLMDDPSNRMFISFWTRPSWGTADEYFHQIKLWRLNSQDDRFLNFKNSHWGPEGSSHIYTRSVGQDLPGGDVTYYGVPFEDEKWFKIEFQAAQSSVGQPDGFVRVWHGRPNGPMLMVYNAPAVVTTGNGLYWDQLQIGQYATNLALGIDSGTINYFDDVYMDNTWARVEIGDEPTWDACTHREMQIPSSWVDNSANPDEPDKITIEVNQGSLPYGTAYLYVVDEDGSRNENGREITIERSPSWLASVIDRWHDPASGLTLENDVGRAVSWYLHGSNPPPGWVWNPGDNPADLGNAWAAVGEY